MHVPKAEGCRCRAVAVTAISQDQRGQRRSAGGRWQDCRVDVDGLRALRRARDRIDRDYAEPLRVPALAAEAGYSGSHFIRAFSDAYGETPARYLSRRRVERACELLRSVNLTVTEICNLVGFASLGTFSARFSELIGMSPTAYRNEALRRGGPAPIPGCFALMWNAGLPKPAQDRNLEEASHSSGSVSSSHDHRYLHRLGLGPRPGQGQGLLHQADGL